MPQRENDRGTALKPTVLWASRRIDSLSRRGQSVGKSLHAGRMSERRERRKGGVGDEVASFPKWEHLSINRKCNTAAQAASHAHKHTGTCSDGHTRYRAATMHSALPQATSTR